ncbi:MAG: hypothetical protein N7Q72_04095 [Spiroplasma sp. Tabriz.8]|nr:hypothetical protein [Spiroplasma sp. Tabriz.8]
MRLWELFLLSYLSRPPPLQPGYSSLSLSLSLSLILRSCLGLLIFS